MWFLSIRQKKNGDPRPSFFPNQTFFWNIPIPVAPEKCELVFWLVLFFIYLWAVSFQKILCVLKQIFAYSCVSGVTYFQHGFGFKEVVERGEVECNWKVFSFDLSKCLMTIIAQSQISRDFILMLSPSKHAQFKVNYVIFRFTSVLYFFPI